jgi:flagellar biosynthesis/type III secretory pathway chaperone
MLNEILLKNLMSVLEQEYKVYEEILKLSKKKTDIIVEGRIAELDNVVKLEQALVAQISRIDTQRELVLNEIVPEKKDINISELKSYADEAQKKSLEEYQKKLTQLIDEMKHVNQLNAKLINNSLEYIDFSLNLITNADATSNNYGNGGDNSQKARKNFFDMKL